MPTQVTPERADWRRFCRKHNPKITDEQADALYTQLLLDKKKRERRKVNAS